MRNPFTHEFFYAIVMRGAAKPRPAGLSWEFAKPAAGGAPSVPTPHGNNLRNCSRESVNSAEIRNKIFMDR
jgi:hypothetical protein